MLSFFQKRETSEEMRWRREGGENEFDQNSKSSRRLLLNSNQQQMENENQ